MSGPLLITGANGQLGRALQRLLVDREVVAVDIDDLDLTDRAAVVDFVGATRPSAIVNCAAMTDVDGCELRPETAWAVNAWAVRNLAEAARGIDAYLCQVSTDYVFPGDKGEPYVEWDATGPASMYGASKLAGEAEAGPGAGIARTAWLCGVDGNNIVKTILRLAGEGKELSFVDDQVGNPSFADDVAARLITMVDERLPGVFHTTNTGHASWYQLAGDVLEAGGFPRSQVRPISTEDLDPPRPAPRPADSRLDGLAGRLAGLDPLPPYRESLARLIAQLPS